MSHKSEFLHDEWVSECSLFNAALQNMEHVHISRANAYLQGGKSVKQNKNIFSNMSQSLEMSR